jgi:predicted nucleotidyltransferase
MTVEEIVRHRLGVDPERIAEFCRKWQIKELALFGSALGDDFRPDSDVDLLVTFQDPERSFGPWMGELQDMEEELVRMFSRPVDFVRRESVERSKNYIRRRGILSNLLPLYVT